MIRCSQRATRVPVAMTKATTATSVWPSGHFQNLKRTTSNCSIATSISVFGGDESLRVFSSADARESVDKRTWCRAQVDETWVVGPEPLSWCRLQ